MKERRKKMSSRHGKEARQPKKPYSKPELKQVPLRPEEAVLGGCKTASASNSPNIGGNCSTPGNCFTILS
jgi:hypothetical protein